MSRIVMVLIWLAVAGAPLAAQQPTPDPRARTQTRETERAGLERRLRQRFAQAVRQRVGLSDDQMTRLQQVSAKYEQQRRPLARDERSARLRLRGLVMNEREADQAQVDALITQLIEIQKQRLALLEQEQRDLAAFMTPVQRARYMAIREQVRRRVEQMRRRREPD